MASRGCARRVRPGHVRLWADLQQSRQKRHWLRMAAAEGHLQAMYLLGMDCDEPDERRRWLRMAAEEGHVVAMYVLGLAAAIRRRTTLAGRSRQEWLAAAMLELAELGY